MAHACCLKDISAHPKACYAGQHDVCVRTQISLCTIEQISWIFAQDEEEVAAPVSQRRKELDIDEDDEDDDHDYMTPEGGFVCETVVAYGLPKGAGIPTEVWLHNSVAKVHRIYSDCTLHTVTPAVSLLSQAILHLCNDRACCVAEWCCALPWRSLPLQVGLQASTGQSICWACSSKPCILELIGMYVLCAMHAPDRLGCVYCQDELFASLRCQPNFPCTRAELSEDLKTLLGYVLQSMQNALCDIHYATYQHDAWCAWKHAQSGV